MAKHSKADVDYSRGMKERHCGKVGDFDKHYCTHFIEPDACSEVEGMIRRHMWCELFKKQEKE